MSDIRIRKCDLCGIYSYCQPWIFGITVWLCPDHIKRAKQHVDDIRDYYENLYREFEEIFEEMTNAEKR